MPSCTPTQACALPPEYRRWQLSRFMGHAQVTTMLATYTHLFDDDNAVIAAGVISDA